MTGQRRDSAAGALWRRMRRRVGWLDHLVRAVVRYDRADGGRLAAAVTYYSFFATFALGLLGVAIFGFVLDDPQVRGSVERYLAEDLPRVNVQAFRDARGTVGVIAFVGLPITGWFWVDALRSSIRRMWELPEYPGNLAARVLLDLLVLVGLGLLLALSMAVAYATTAAANHVVDAADTGIVLSRWLLKGVGLAVGIGFNSALAAGALTAVPRVRMPWRRLWGPALLVALGLELLKTLGGIYVRLTEANPAYQLVAGSVGLLVFLNAINQLLLFAAALTATSTVGRPADLADEDEDGSAAAPRRPADADAATHPPGPGID